jgi:hypothetical protein
VVSIISEEPARSPGAISPQRNSQTEAQPYHGPVEAFKTDDKETTGVIDLRIEDPSKGRYGVCAPAECKFGIQ